jgi:ABC-type Zn2+ transport system substrate-binding protein/surface adhesin
MQKKKELNVGEVQTLPPLQFVISQRETEKRDKRTQRDRESKDGKEGNKTKHTHMGGRKLWSLWVVRERESALGT